MCIYMAVSHLFSKKKNSTDRQHTNFRENTCTDASEQSEPSEPNGEPVWTAIYTRHVKICT